MAAAACGAGEGLPWRTPCCCVFTSTGVMRSRGIRMGGSFSARHPPSHLSAWAQQQVYFLVGLFLTFRCATFNRLCSRLCSLKCCHLTAFCCRLSDATHEQCVAMCWHAEWWRGSENATSGLQSWQWRSACHVKKYTGPLRQQRKTERARQGTGLRRAGKTATLRQRENKWN